LNLPVTRFDMKANLKVREPEVQARWRTMGLYQRIREARAGAPRKVLHDGPPYANGEIHMGHLLNKVLKDVVVRYLTMRGLDSPYVPGWDCHGLPIEHKVLKDLGPQAAALSASEVRARCRDEALHWVDVQRKDFQRLGVEGDWDNPYLTLDPRYEAEAWLEEHARAGDVVETYALNGYLPRFPAKTKVVRVGPGPADKRNPLPAVTEVQDAYGNVAARRPRFIVVSQGWVWRYLLDPEQHMEPGRVLPPTQKSTGAEADGSSFFRGLVAGQRGYREAYKARWTSKIFPRLDLHASTGQEVWIYERVDP
jgi:hypothetical protein